jgi:ribosomal-protein-alanine acetyltransferase
MPTFTIRNARQEDLDQLAAIEAASFARDQLSRRSMRRLLGSPSAAFRVATRRARVLGYHVLLFRAGSRAARLYSIAVSPDARGEGVGDALLADAETIAARGGCAAVRLEVRVRNAAAKRLYERAGYRTFGRHRHYYADNADALRYEKPLGRRRDVGG